MGNNNQYYKPKKDYKYICKLSQQKQQNEYSENSQNFRMGEECLQKCEKNNQGSFKVKQINFFSMKKILLTQKESCLKNKIWLDLEQDCFKKEYRMKEKQILRLNNLAIKIKAIIGMKEYQKLEYLKKRNLLYQGEFPNYGLIYVVEKTNKYEKIVYENFNINSCVTVSTQSSLLNQKVQNQKCRICLELVANQNNDFLNCKCFKANPVHFQCFKKFMNENFKVI